VASVTQAQAANKSNPPTLRGRPVIDCYVRNSTALQIDNWRAEYQKAELPRIVRENGYEPEIWEEQGQSGETLEARQKMMAILERVRTKVSIGIATVDFGRLSRDIDMIDGLKIWETCKRAGAIIVTPGKVWHPGAAQDDDFAFITFWYESRNKRDIVTKLFQGLVKRAEHGPMFRGPSMYGYDTTIIEYQMPGGRTRRSLGRVINEDEAHVCREIAQMYLSMGMTQIRDILSEKAKTDQKYVWKVKQKHPEYPSLIPGWTEQAIKRILHNPLYRGMQPMFLERRSTLYRQAPMKTHYIPELQIFPDDLARTIDIVAATRKVGTGGRIEPNSPYTKLLKCPHCGWYLTLQSSVPSQTEKKRTAKRYYYDCSLKVTYGKARCAGLRLTTEAIHAAIVPLVQSQLDQLATAELETRAAALLSGSDHQERVLRGEEAALRKAIDDYTRDYYVTKKLPIPETIFLETMAGWSAQLAEKQKRIHDLGERKRVAAGPDVLALLDELRGGLGEILASEAPTVQNTILKSLFVDIVMERGDETMPRGSGYRHTARVVRFEPVYKYPLGDSTSM
jgi:Resolvase, N terminal domain/Recombinase zinc beta ribbon domain/Recombinase